MHTQGRTDFLWGLMAAAGVYPASAGHHASMPHSGTAGGRTGPGQPGHCQARPPPGEPPYCLGQGPAPCAWPQRLCQACQGRPGPSGGRRQRGGSAQTGPLWETRAVRAWGAVGGTGCSRALPRGGRTHLGRRQCWRRCWPAPAGRPAAWGGTCTGCAVRPGASRVRTSSGRQVDPRLEQADRGSWAPRLGHVASILTGCSAPSVSTGHHRATASAPRPGPDPPAHTLAGTAPLLSPAGPVVCPRPTPAPASPPLCWLPEPIHCPQLPLCARPGSQLAPRHFQA